MFAAENGGTVMFGGLNRFSVLVSKSVCLALTINRKIQTWIRGPESLLMKM